MDARDSHTPTAVPDPRPAWRKPALTELSLDGSEAKSPSERESTSGSFAYGAGS